MYTIKSTISLDQLESIVRAAMIRNIKEITEFCHFIQEEANECYGIQLNITDIHFLYHTIVKGDVI